MDKNALTLAEALQYEKDLKKQNVIVVEPAVEVPEGIYDGNFQTQEKAGKKEPVIRCIEYVNPVTAQKMAFFSAKTDLISQEGAKGYNSVGVALNDQLKEYLATSANLAKDHIFRSRKGRVRTFVQLAEE